MYSVPKLADLNIYEYRRIMAQPIAPAPREYVPPHTSAESLERELLDAQDKLKQIAELRRVLETKIVFLRRHLRLARQRMRNAGWPTVDRRRVPRPPHGNEDD